MLMTCAEIVSWGQEQLLSCHVPDAGVDAWLLFEYVTGMDRAAYFLRKQETLAKEDDIRYRHLIQQRGERIPLQYLTGEQEFMGLPFYVDEAVLIPRQDTETLVELALPHVQGKRVLDVCTGSGCIAVALQKLGGPALCHAVDLSAAAIAVAKKNIGRLRAEVQVWQSDLLEQVTERYDLIVSNPPYIPPDIISGLMPEVREHEPLMALDGGTDGLDFYRRLAAESAVHLTENGRLYLEIAHDQGDAAARLLREHGFREIQVHQDLAGNDRVISAVRN